MTRREFESVEVPLGSRRFVVVRDLRDTLVSWYFSLKLSHGLDHRPDLVADRDSLRSMSLKQGLEWLLDHWAISKSAEIQRTWLGSGDPYIRYEDLLSRDTKLMREVLIDHCGIPITPAEVVAAVENARFSRMSGGRERGQERPGSHQRKGVAGDWRNYFSHSLKRAFDNRYGDILIETGYEQGPGW